MPFRPSALALLSGIRRPGSRRASGALAGAALATAIAAAAIATGAAVSLPARAQAPLQSPLGAGEQSRPLERAQAALKSGNPARALGIADAALKTFPNDAQLRFVRGVAMNQLGRLPEAEAAFVSLTQEYPELPEPYNNLAVVRAAQGRLDEARAALEDAIRAVPDYAVAHENLGDIYAQLAARSFRNAQRLDPANKALAAKLRTISGLAASPAASPAATAPPARRP